MTIPSPTPKQRRATRQAEAARALDASLQRHSLSRAQLAAKVGVPEQHAHEWATAEADRNMQLADAAGAPDLVRVDLAEHILGPTYVAALLPSVDKPVDDVRAAARIAHGGGAVLGDYLEAIADGTIDRPEATALRARLRAHIRDCVSLELSLEQAEKSHGRAVVSAIGAARRTA